MSNADRVVNLLDRCLRYVNSDASKKLYGKTALKYQEVVDRINLLATVTESLMSKSTSGSEFLTPSSCFNSQPVVNDGTDSCGSDLPGCLHPLGQYRQAENRPGKSEAARGFRKTHP